MTTIQCQSNYICTSLISILLMSSLGPNSEKTVKSAIVVRWHVNNLFLGCSIVAIRYYRCHSRYFNAHKFTSKNPWTLESRWSSLSHQFKQTVFWSHVYMEMIFSFNNIIVIWLYGCPENRNLKHPCVHILKILLKFKFVGNKSV